MAIRRHVLLWSLLVAIATSKAQAQSAAALADLPRRPVALVRSDRELVAANRCGTLSLIDLDTLAVRQEVSIGEQLSDLVLDRAAGQLVVTDSQAHQAIVLQQRAGTWEVQQRIAVPWSPVSIERGTADSQRTYYSIACLWARQLAILEPLSRDDWQLTQVIDLPFAPRCQWIDEQHNRILVADAFGDRLAVIDPLAGKIVALRTLPGRNIRGIAATPDGQSLLFALQLINEFVPTERDRVVWGAVLSNLVIKISRDELLTGAGDPATPSNVPHWSLYPLGAAGHGSGDPADIHCDAAGRWTVALGGIDEVVQLRSARQERRCTVGRRPTCLLEDPQRGRWYVANTLGDSISVIDAQSFTIKATIQLGSHVDVSPADEGESLFYDARLSLDGWYSCHSCHADGHTIEARSDNLADGDYGAPKRIPSLLGTSGTGPWAWNASRQNLHEQIDKSVHSTMQGGNLRAIGEREFAAIAEYLHSLTPPPSIDRARGNIESAAVDRGRQLFSARGCIDCHAPPQYTSADVYDVNLVDERQRRHFNPPSLQGVSQRDHLLHDNRADSLRAVFEVHRHPSGSDWRPEELDDLLAFLRTL